MNCREFSNLVSEFVDAQQSNSASHDVLLQHAATCPACNLKLQNERTVSAGLQLLAKDDLRIQAPSFLRSHLLAAFESHTGAAPSNVVSFPSRSNWTRWALAAAAMIVLGFVLFAARWIPGSERDQTAQSVIPAFTAGPGEAGLKSESKERLPIEPGVAVVVASNKGVAHSRRPGNPTNKSGRAKSVSDETQVASFEVKSEFVPLTYLNSATAMDSGIVVRVEIAREQLATLGIPFDTERADEVIRADIVVGDDGVARAIRLVQ